MTEGEGGQTLTCFCTLEDCLGSRLQSNVRIRRLSKRPPRESERRAEWRTLRNSVDTFDHFLIQDKHRVSWQRTQLAQGQSAWLLCLNSRVDKTPCTFELSRWNFFLQLQAASACSQSVTGAQFRRQSKTRKSAEFSDRGGNRKLSPMIPRNPVGRPTWVRFQAKEP